MGTEILRPQDCFIRVGGGSFRSNINRKQTGKFRIKTSVSGDLRNMKSGFSTSSSSGSESEVYAGNAFCCSSPAPSSLPLPTFSIKKEGFRCGFDDDLATKDLRRLLRID